MTCWLSGHVPGAGEALQDLVVHLRVCPLYVRTYICTHHLYKCITAISTQPEAPQSARRPGPARLSPPFTPGRVILLVPNVLERGLERIRAYVHHHTHHICE